MGASRAFVTANSDNITAFGSNTHYNFIHQTNVFSVSFWILITDYTTVTHGVVVNATNGSSADRGLFIYFNTDFLTNGFRFAVCKGTGGTFGALRDDASTFSDSSWHHVLWTIDNSTINFYLDGVKQGAAGTINGTNTGDATAAMTVGSIGASAYGSFKMADLRIWDVTLTDAQAKRVYYGAHVRPADLQLWVPLRNSGTTTAYDKSGNGRNGTINGADEDFAGPPLGRPLVMYQTINPPVASSGGASPSSMLLGYW